MNDLQLTVRTAAQEMVYVSARLSVIVMRDGRAMRVMRHVPVDIMERDAKSVTASSPPDVIPFMALVSVCPVSLEDAAISDAHPGHSAGTAGITVSVRTKQNVTRVSSCS
jgi:hypothetical protein